MATAHFTRTVYKSGGVLARGRVEYITRTGQYASPADARIQHQGLEASTGHVREDLVYWRARNLPQWATDDPVRFFSTAEQHERTGGVAYTEWRFALPRELTHRHNMALARDVLDASFGTTHPYVFAFHDPPAADGGSQPHVHVIFSARTVDRHNRTPAQFFKRWNAAHPERGGAQKDPALNHFGAVKAVRVLYTDIVNLHLAQHGYATRLHPDRLEDRGFDRTPEPRLLPSDSNALKHHGVMTTGFQEVFAHRAAHATEREAEQVQARVYWEHRERVLGLTRAMGRDDALARIRADRQAAVSHKRDRDPVRQRTPVERELIERITATEDYLTRVQAEQREERVFLAQGRARPIAGQRQAERVLADGWEYGIAATPERTAAEREARLVLPLVGNRQSRIYHAAGDPNYGDVVPQHQVLFWSHAAAEDAGYREAINQHYGRGADARMEERDRARRHPVCTRGSGAQRERRAPHIGRRPVGPDGPHGHGLRVRIFEREDEYGRDI